MSAGSAKDFLNKIANDDQFRRAVVTAMQQKPNETAAITALAAGAGYTFTANEISEVLKGFTKGEEMSEVELQTVAGGFNPQPEPPIVYRGLQNIFRPRFIA